MAKLKWFWNFVFYSMYKLQLGVHKLFSILNPVTYFVKMPFVERSFSKKRGIDDISTYIETSSFNNPKSGIPIIWAGIHVGILLMSLELISFNLFQVSIKKNLFDYIFDNNILAIIAIFALVIPQRVLNYYTLFKNKKYLSYFQKFDKISRSKLIIYYIICLVTYVLLVVLSIYSFSWLAKLT